MIKNRIKHDNSKSPLVENYKSSCKKRFDLRIGLGFHPSLESKSYTLWRRHTLTRDELKVVSYVCHKGRVCRIVKNTLSVLRKLKMCRRRPKKRTVMKCKLVFRRNLKSISGWAREVMFEKVCKFVKFGHFLVKKCWGKWILDKITKNIKT